MSSHKNRSSSMSHSQQNSRQASETSPILLEMDRRVDLSSLNSGSDGARQLAHRAAVTATRPMTSHRMFLPVARRVHCMAVVLPSKGTRLCVFLQSISLSRRILTGSWPEMVSPWKAHSL